MSSLTIQRIEAEGPLYAEEQELRNRVLLRPFGLPDHAWEMHDAASWHFVALDAGELVGCVLLCPRAEDETRARLFQMAVDERCQGQGVGAQLLAELVRFGRSHGVREVSCHARENAVRFYAKHGFETYGEPFEEVGLVHRHMRRRLD